MNDNPTPTAKPEPATTPKAPVKSTKPAASKADATGPLIKSTPINPAKAYGFSGPLADAIANHLTAAVAKHLEKATRPDKLTKLVKEAANQCIGQFA
jgi:hypothetical protein